MKAKQILAILLALALTLGTGQGPRAQADYAPETDYMGQMILAAAAGDLAAGRQAQRCRDEKIAALGLAYPKVSFDDLLLLAKIMTAEAGSDWLGDEWKLAVGEVVLNRVASPEFPNTIAAVLAQPGQYYGPGSGYFANLRPSLRCAVLAAWLLQGGRIIRQPSVVFQANVIQGSGVYAALYDSLLGYTYLCFSYHPELYR